MAYTFQRPMPLETQIDDTFANVIQHVYLWMWLGLFVTALVSAALVYTPLFWLLRYVLAVPLLFYALMFVELGLVWWLSARVYKLAPGTARMLFLLYAVLNGVTLSVIFLVYTASNIALAFLATAGMFGAMSVVGYVTDLDLSRWGSFLLMGLLGLMIGSVVNLFLANSTLDWLLTYGGIILFLGLTVYDTQRIKRMTAAALRSLDGEETVRRVGILGALRLYLDFINLFLMLLRVTGGRRRR